MKSINILDNDFSTYYCMLYSGIALMAKRLLILSEHEFHFGSSGAQRGNWVGKTKIVNGPVYVKKTKIFEISDHSIGSLSNIYKDLILILIQGGKDSFQVRDFGDKNGVPISLGAFSSYYSPETSFQVNLDIESKITIGTSTLFSIM
ncbi:hypothetical protein PHYBLDRAFT_161047 [Phycomyces blakesleeanus NRRL 1555(-)]|uniref:Uncharacterized protein n=1 Tax=Phycomyces blakesleeanus (strain ATCC 8743b / DSM 1359 / FGSC 10004 / NBRC 33097 / NRRL 1555) TaxID=763407 RepID=A0A167QWU0_PHYB8|nr:hypothetical protein PHYBLDRAFT_161047 [Phycomyces blakesleeanus NRRL 1555(-)]OAD80401.1 hypothetical protein PHYBLDRAFT_161047 [Phycomyces blakesleeanus NRRL 1555(-)]|eukprot:XP_018298441.1 hypothetical protein PHYBLDRAFT_161047 [Phycomyces blakesleeanus NRRL 1555(-)]